ncbi:protein phosphatase [Rhodobacter sp. SGA-6-6]|uniref:phosphatase domain-containing protein n=1 Tax=Rhodobacter sp. SGA-6-6 TaxID=2710882 RepID=UPI0013ECA921|nr:protein-tyrosine phosphatase family protein [Rhodobacter sp. SGA-6-6]NGM44861.1 protein phosphatase [Rhodobacter sp. SGA-6-6]
MALMIASLPAGGGELALCPMPGRGGAYGADLREVLAWGPGLVLTMATAEELAAKGAGDLAEDLAAHGIRWRHLPVADFGLPEAAVASAWPAVAAEARAVLAGGGRVLVHCLGGCGRSGMAVLRLLVETGEAPQSALARLRAVRPCAVETEAQFLWASAG